MREMPIDRVEARETTLSFSDIGAAAKFVRGMSSHSQYGSLFRAVHLIRALPNL